MVELTWDGKYDASGKRAAPLRLKLPFQTVETVNESAQQRQLALDLFNTGRPTAWRNRLIWGDKKYVLPALLDEFAGQVDLIYIDPPFNIGANFSFQVEIEEERFTKEPTVIEQKAYRDTWGRGLDGYLQWFYETVVMLRELLTENGSIYVHCDSGVNSYIRAILDEVFSSDNMRNEIVWRRANAHNDPKRCGIIIDTIYYYARGNNPTWNTVYTPYSEEYIKSHWSSKDENGRRYRLIPLDAPRHGGGGNLVYEWKGKWPAKSRTWSYTKEGMEELEKEGRITYTSTGTPNLKRYIDETPGLPLQNLWEDIPPVNPMAKERVDYATQKPQALLERIITASSNEGDLVLDCFCLRAGSRVRVVEAPPIPPVDGGEQEKSPRKRGDLGGHLAIEQIRPGSWVIGHDGQAHQVRQIHRREYQGQMIGLEREGSDQTLWLTADHRILCQKRPLMFPRQPNARSGWSHVSPEMFARSQELRKQSTPAEKKLWQALRSNQLGVAFRRQHPLGPYIADFYSRQAALVIELDGASHTSAAGQAHDAKRTAWIEQIGLRVIRFWNQDVMSNLPGALQIIQSILAETIIENYPDREWRRAADLCLGDEVFWGDDLRLAKITRIQHEQTSETVFDLTVEHTHSYLTDVCLVHNCGSGTTAAVAEKLNRRWITCDLGRFAIHTARKRLLSIENVKPFVVQNLGKYERQAWQAAEFNPLGPPLKEER